MDLKLDNFFHSNRRINDLLSHEPSIQWGKDGMYMFYKSVEMW